MTGSLARQKFGKEIKRMRKTVFQGKSQQYFAQKINIELKDKSVFFQQKHISEIENGKVIKLPKNFANEIYNYSISVGFDFDKSCVDEFNEELNEEYLKPKTLISVKEHNSLLTNPKILEVGRYIGKYYCIFHSTDSSEDKFITGEMEIKPDETNKSCVVEFSIFEGNKKIKSYLGLFMLNSHYNMWYSILISEQSQEVSVIAAQHFNSAIRNNLLNVALVITTSAGLRKRPTMHRMFISREMINEENIDLLLAQLKLNSDKIIVSESKIKELEDDIINKIEIEKRKGYIEIYNAVLKSIEIIKKSEPPKYYIIDEAMLFDSNLVSSDKKLLSYVISIIRKYTDEKYYNKLSDTVHEICTKLMID